MEIGQIIKEIQKKLTFILKIVYLYAEAFFRLFVPPPMKSIDGETILVTGAVGGIGQEICRNLVKSGSDLTLVLWDLKKDDLDRFAEELNSSGAPGLKVFCFSVDISSKDDIETGCKQVKNAVGNITIIFNNAGICAIAKFLHQTDQQIEKTISINLTSHLWILRQFLPGMVSSNHGRIVTTCSIAGLKPGAHSVPYCASKFGVNGYTESLKTELRMQKPAYDGIKFTTVYPYLVQTPLLSSLAINTEFGNKLPLGMHKIYTPEEVGKKMVDGMRREYEHIYIPNTMHFLCFLEYVFPLKVMRALEESHADTDNWIFKDVNEQERIFNAPYLPTIVKNCLENGHDKRI